jgi:hypothetical protein
MQLLARGDVEQAHYLARAQERQPLPVRGKDQLRLAGRLCAQSPEFLAHRDLPHTDEAIFGSGAFPIWQECPDEWMASLGARGEWFHTHAFLPTTGQAFPDDLWNLRASTSYRHQFDNEWIAGATVSVGSASDRPFHSINEMTSGVNAFLRIPSGEHNAWLFSLAYSPTNELNFPIPGAAYVYQPSDRFRMNIGLPFLLYYRPVEDLTLDLSYMLLRTVHARATYRVCSYLRCYVGFDWENESYFLAYRPDNNDRFFYYDKRLAGGLQMPLHPQVMLDFSAGYIFDRFYFEGRSYSDRDFNRLDVGNGPYASIQCHVRW